VNFQAGLTCRDNDGIDVHGLLRERERERERGKRRRAGDMQNFPSPPQIFIKDNTFSKKLRRLELISVIFF
jgi:hypothetical protein